MGIQAHEHVDPASVLENRELMTASHPVTEALDHLTGTEIFKEMGGLSALTVKVCRGRLGDCGEVTRECKHRFQLHKCF